MGHERSPLACWVKTGERIRVAEEVDHGADGFARSEVEIVQGRYVGVRRSSYDNQSTSVTAAVYDLRKDKRLHSSAACDQLQFGEFYGVQDVAFLAGCGMAIACDRLRLYRRATATPQTLEPAGVHRIALSRTFLRIHRPAAVRGHHHPDRRDRPPHPPLSPTLTRSRTAGPGSTFSRFRASFLRVGQERQRRRRWRGPWTFPTTRSTTRWRSTPDRRL